MFAAGAATGALAAVVVYVVARLGWIGTNSAGALSAIEGPAKVSLKGAVAFALEGDGQAQGPF
jgi:hypothetical protein